MTYNIGVPGDARPPTVHQFRSRGKPIQQRLLDGHSDCSCWQMLGHLVPAFLTVWIDHGADEDWSVMCYPRSSG